jgi:hypothetical protein
LFEYLLDVERASCRGDQKAAEWDRDHFFDGTVGNADRSGMKCGRGAWDGLFALFR